MALRYRRSAPDFPSPHGAIDGNATRLASGGSPGALGLAGGVEAEGSELDLRGRVLRAQRHAVVRRLARLHDAADRLVEAVRQRRTIGEDHTESEGVAHDGAVDLVVQQG